jgi:hypothetical protein
MLHEAEVASTPQCWLVGTFDNSEECNRQFQHMLHATLIAVFQAGYWTVQGSSSTKHTPFSVTAKFIKDLRVRGALN